MPISKGKDHSAARALGRHIGYLVGAVLVLYLVVLIVFKGTWDVLVPALFPGAVEQGLVAKTISWGTAFLLSGALSLVLLWAALDQRFVVWFSGQANSGTRGQGQRHRDSLGDRP